MKHVIKYNLKIFTKRNSEINMQGISQDSVQMMNDGMCRPATDQGNGIAILENAKMEIHIPYSEISYIVVTKEEGLPLEHFREVSAVPQLPTSYVPS